MGQNRAERLGGTRPGEWRCARQHLVQHHAERKDVAPRIDRLAARLFGRHIGDGAKYESVGGPHVRARNGRGIRSVFAVRLDQPGDAKVDNLGVAIVRQDHVFGLEIAVQHAVLVHLGHGAGDMDRQIERTPERQGALPE